MVSDFLASQNFICLYLFLDDRAKSTGYDSDANDIPRVGLEEMLNDLVLEDQEMASESDSD